MSAHQALYPIATMCRVLEVSTSGYYAWRTREPSKRSKSDTALTAVIREIHKWSRGTYGVPRMIVELEARGHHANSKRYADCHANQDTGQALFLLLGLCGRELYGAR